VGQRAPRTNPEKSHTDSENDKVENEEKSMKEIETN
jgi:hypothetical protein